MAAVTFYTVGEKQIFRATATLQIDPNPTQPLGTEVQAFVNLGAGSFWTNREYYATQYKIIAGRSIASETVRVLGLARDAAFMSNASPGKRIAPVNTNVSIDEAADVLISRLKVEPVKDSRLAVVTYDDANKDRARLILAAHIEIYLANNVNRAVASTGAASDWLRGQVTTLKGQLEDSELALHEFKKENRILSLSLDDQSNMLREEMKQFNEALTAVRTRRETLLAREHELASIDASDPSKLPASEMLNNNLLTSLRSGYITAKVDLASLLGSGKGENHPQAEAARTSVESTKNALVAEIENVRGAVHSELMSVTREAGGLSALLEQAKQRALDLNMLEIEYHRLQRTKETTEKLYGLVINRSKESDFDWHDAF